jgi:hypothetical protein
MKATFIVAVPLMGEPVFRKLTKLRFRLLQTYKQWCTQEFCRGGGGGSINSVEDRGQIERGSGGSNPLVRGSAKFANE